MLKIWTNLKRFSKSKSVVTIETNQKVISLPEYMAPSCLGILKKGAWGNAPTFQKAGAKRGIHSWTFTTLKNVNTFSWCSKAGKTLEDKQTIWT